VTTLIDRDARARIETDLDVNMCVEAGAGTGKTTMLVRRIVALLRSGAATVDDLAVITFTEKAAAELSARVRFAIEGSAADSDDAEERTRLEQALRDLYRARIQTIHAFAGDLLRERPVEAGIDPQFVVMEELEASLDFDLAYQRWLDDLLASSREEVEIAIRRGFDLWHMRQVAQLLERRRHVLPLAGMKVDEPDLDSYRAWAAAAGAELDECEPYCTDLGDGAYRQLAGIRQHLALVEKADDAELERLVLFETPSPNIGVGSKGKWNPPESCDRVKKVFGELRDERAPELAEGLRTAALVRILGHVERFVTDYAEERREQGRATFEDLLIRARDLLRDDQLVRDHFHKRSRRVLVDEFQDTDPIQAELIAWITAPTGASGDWRTVEPEPGALFVVGDPKQSIYRFRGADIAAYDAVKNGPLEGRLERLEQNFRSNSSVLDWINGVFDRVFVEAEGVQPANSHLHASDTAIDDLLERPAVVVVQSTREWGDKQDTAEATRIEESSLLARTIARAVRDERWQVRDRHAGDQVRPAQWRDVAILVPARTRLEVLEEQLLRYDVPCRIEGGRGFYSRQEVRDTVTVLEAIDDPVDQIAIVGALRSLAFGCSDDDLLLYKAANGRFDYRHIGEQGPESVRESLQVLQSLYRQQRSLSLGELVRRTVEESGLVEAALTVPGGDQAAANILKVVDIAQAFSGAGGGALRRFATWLVRNRDEREDELDAPVAEERDDLVRVMTIHAAKGLEFPIVALAYLGWTGTNQVPPIPAPAEHLVHFSVGNRYGRFTTPDWEEHKAAEREALEAERERLLYVAVTRARDHLIIPAAVPLEDAKPRTFLEKLAPSVTTAWEYDATSLAGVPERRPEEVTMRADEAAERSALEARGDFVAERDVAVRNASRGVELVVASSVKSEARPLVAAAESADGARDDRPAGIDTDAAPPLELGDAFHRVIELVDVPALETLEPLAAAICEEHGISEHADAVVAMVRRTLDALRQEGIPVESMHREVPFVAPDGGKVLIGRLDLAGPDGGGCDVVDFKTDLRGSESLAAAVANHKGQLETYGRALELAFATEESRVRVVFSRTGEIGSST
jgi:ATP-dependent exoDNAse (exonuclease V) beta subunit